MDMTPEVGALLKRSITDTLDKHYRAEIRPGEYRIDATVRIRGTFVRGVDGTVVQKNKIDHEALFYALASRVNSKTIARALDDYRANRDNGTLAEFKEDLLDAMRDGTWMAVQELADEVEQERMGSIRPKVVVELISRHFEELA